MEEFRPWTCMYLIFIDATIHIYRVIKKNASALWLSINSDRFEISFSNFQNRIFNRIYIDSTNLKTISVLNSK